MISVQACEGFRSLIQKQIGLVEKSMHGSTGKQETSWPFTYIVGVGEVKGCIQTNGQNTWHLFGILILVHIPVNFSPRDVAQQGCVWPCHREQQLHKWNTNLLNAPFTQSVPTLIHWHYPQFLQSIPRNLKGSRPRQCGQVLLEDRQYKQQYNMEHMRSCLSFNQIHDHGASNDEVNIDLGAGLMLCLQQ